MANKNTYFPHIDGLRCLAVLAVVFMHLGIQGFSGGFVGVDIFFVISGFLITGIIVREIEETGTFSFLNFYYRRARRILPALVFVLLLSLLAAIYCFDVGAFINFGKSLAAASLGVSNMYFCPQGGYFDSFSKMNPLLHTWSLGVEEQFYLFWPLAIFLLTKKFPQKIKKNVIIITVIIFIISFTVNIACYKDHLRAVFYYAPTRAFEFCIGAALVVFPKLNRSSPLLADMICVLGYLLIGVSVYCFNSQTPFPSYYALLPTLGAGLLIYSGSNARLGHMLMVRPIRYIGLISYSLYLTHWPLIVFSQYIKEGPLENEGKVFVLIFSFLISHLIYHGIEQPFRRKNDDNKRKKLFLSSTIIVMLVVAAIGISFRSFTLWSWRIDPLIADEYQYRLTSVYHEENWGGAGFSGGYLHRGKSEKPRLVILGDSHSGMMDEGVVRYISKPLNLTTYTISGGGAGSYPSEILLPGLVRKEPKAQGFYDAAEKKALDDLVGVMQEAGSSVLMVSFSYVSQLASTVFMDGHNPLGVDCDVTKYSGGLCQPLLDSFDKLHEIIGEEHEIIIVGDVPGSSFIAEKCLQPLRKWLVVKKCSYQDPIERSLKRKQFNDALRRYALSHEGVYFIDPFDIFCSGGFCRSVAADGKPYYSDGDHLSKTGSRYFIKNVRNKIIEALGGHR